MRRRFFAIVSFFCLLVLPTKAQQEVSFSHYWAVEPSFNPAAVGKEAKLNIAGAYAMTMTGFENHPKTMYVAADMPFYLLGAYHGVGAQVMDDEIGLFSHRRFSLQYAYKQKVLGGTLSVGLQLSLLSEGFDGTRLEVEDGDDPALSGSEVSGAGISFSAGAYYTYGDGYVGVSVLQLNSPTVELGERSELSVSPTYYLTGGYNIRLTNPLFSIHPTVLGCTDGVSYRADVSARLRYAKEQKMMYCGLGYSPTRSVTVMLGGNFHGVTLGYSYEVYTSALSIGNGSHEIFLGYQMDLDLYKKGKNKHKSVRLL